MFLVSDNFSDASTSSLIYGKWAGVLLQDFLNQYKLRDTNTC